MIKNLDNNVIYKNQFAIMAFIAMVVFKVAMLPSYLYQTAGRDSWISVGIMLIFEGLMFLLVLYSSKKINLLADSSKWLAVVHILVFIFSMIKMTTLYSGLITYTSTSLFDQGRINFILLSFAIVIPYFVSKGGNSIARLFELTFYSLLAVLFVMVLTPKFKMDITELLPILVDGGKGMANGLINYVVWFGDYLPLAYFVVKDSKNKILNKASVPVALVVGVVGVVLFYIAYIGVYGEAGGIVSFAFNRMAVFNTISDLLGATNFLSIIVWLMMALLQITLIFLTATNALLYFVRNKIAAISIVLVIVTAVQWFFVNNIETAHDFAVSFVKYIALGCQVSVPIILAIYARRKSKEQV